MFLNIGTFRLQNVFNNFKHYPYKNKVCKQAFKYFSVIFCFDFKIDSFNRSSSGNLKVLSQFFDDTVLIIDFWIFSCNTWGRVHQTPPNQPRKTNYILLYPWKVQPPAGNWFPLLSPDQKHNTSFKFRKNGRHPC